MAHKIFRNLFFFAFVLGLFSVYLTENFSSFTINQFSVTSTAEVLTSQVGGNEEIKLHPPKNPIKTTKEQVGSYMNAIMFLGLIIIGMIVFLVGRLEKLGKFTLFSKLNFDLFNSRLAFIFYIAWFSSLFYFAFSWADIYILPDSASEHGEWIDSILALNFWVTGIVFVITQFLLYFFIYKYYYKKDRKAHYFPENNKLELLWTVVPAIALTFLVGTGVYRWQQIMSPEYDNPLQINIMGYQFAWEVRYPGNDGKFGATDFTKINGQNSFGMTWDKEGQDDLFPRELHMPVNRQIVFKIKARDVLHSVYAPHFRLKMDAVPGMPTSFTFRPIKTTEQMRKELNNPDFDYEIACAEMCGKGHWAMRLKVVVETQKEFDKWLAGQTPKYKELMESGNIASK